MSNCKLGFLLAILLFVVPFIIYFLPVESSDYQLSTYTKSTYMKSKFSSLNSFVANLFNELEAGRFNLLSEFGLKIQIFIAFSYSYHYLNWFSKTSIIGWRKSINKKNAIVILMLWISAMSIYLYDYGTGFIVLLFLSLLHVFLEFPLNVVTIREVFLRIKRK